MAYPTLTELKTSLGVSGSSLDTPLGHARSAAIAYVEAECGRKFEQVTEIVLFDVKAPYVWGGNRNLNTYRDFTAVSALLNGDGVAITAYNLVPAESTIKHAIALKPAAPSFNSGGVGGRISVNGTWQIDTPGDIFKLILDIARFEYLSTTQGAGGEVVQTGFGTGLAIQAGGLPDHMQAVIEKHRRTVV